MSFVCSHFAHYSSPQQHFTKRFRHLLRLQLADGKSSLFIKKSPGQWETTLEFFPKWQRRSAQSPLTRCRFEPLQLLEGTKQSGIVEVVARHAVMVVETRNQSTSGRCRRRAVQKPLSTSRSRKTL